MKRAISLSIFLAIAVYAIWNIMQSHNNDDQLQSTKSTRFVEIFMNEFKLTALNENGKPAYIMTGEKLEKFNDADITEIEHPVFQLLQNQNDNRSNWKINADNATINNKDEIIILKNNVVMQQQNIEPAVTIRTQRLDIDTRKQLARTTALVEITQGNSHMNSNGMIFDNTTSDLELSSKVHGYIQP